MKVHKVVLKSGLTLVVVPKKSATAAAVFTTEAGGWFDFENKEGMAHFCEHMPFKGTEKHPTPQALVEASEGIGAEVNAHTDQEHMAFEIQVPPQKIEEALDWLNQVSLHALIPEKEVEKERSVVIEEARMYIDRHDRFAYAKAIEGLYPGARWGIPIEGTEETIKNTSVDDLKQFYKQQFHPKKSVLVVYGDVNPGKIESKVAELYGGWKTDEKFEPEREPQRIPSRKSSLIVNEREVQQVYMTAMTHGISEADDDYYSASTAKIVFGSGQGSKLFKKVREERGLCYYIYASLDAYKRIGSLMIGSGLNTKNTKMAGEIIRDQIEEMLSGEISAKELSRAKLLTKTAVLSVYDDPMEAAHRIAERFLTTGEVELGADVDKEIEAVSMDDVVCAAKKILGFEEGVVSVVAPKGVDVSGLEAITS